MSLPSAMPDVGAAESKTAISPATHRSRWLVALLAVFAVALLVASQWLFGGRVLLVVLGLLAAAVLVKYPEVCLLLFLTAGTFKTEIAAVAGTSIDLTVVLAAVLAAGVLVRLPARGFRALLPPGRLAVPFILFAVLMLISALAHPDTAYGQAKTLRFALLTGLAVFAPCAVITSEVRFRRLLACAVVLGVLMVLAGRVTSEGLAAFDATHIATGRVLGLGVIGVLYFLLRMTQPASTARRFFWLAPGVLLGFGFLYSGSRGSMVAIIAAVALAGVISFGIGRGRRWVMAGIVLLAVSLAAVTVVKPEAVETMNRRMAYTFSGPIAVTARTRVDRAAAALELLREHPLTGVGVGGFDLAWGYGDATRGDYPHNILLEVGAELGVLGLVLVSVLIGAGLVAAVKAMGRGNRGDTFAVGMAVFVITAYFLVNAMFSGDLNDNRLLFASLGLCAALPRLAPGTRSDNSDG